VDRERRGDAGAVEPGGPAGDQVVGAEQLAELDRVGVPLERAPADKDESDTELAVLAAVRLGASRITILGGLGGRRLDHALANVALLAHPTLAGRDVCLLDDRTRVSLVDASGERSGDQPVRRPLPGRPGDLVSLLPWGGPADGVTTEGLRYVLDDERLEAGPARGLSNVREVEHAWVSVRRGRVLVVESPARLSA
jgi:thiamine pyrophosphokinase